MLQQHWAVLEQPWTKQNGGNGALRAFVVAVIARSSSGIDVEEQLHGLHSLASEHYGLLCCVHAYYSAFAFEDEARLLRRAGAERLVFDCLRTRTDAAALLRSFDTVCRERALFAASTAAAQVTARRPRQPSPAASPEPEVSFSTGLDIPGMILWLIQSADSRHAASGDVVAAFRRFIAAELRHLPVAAVQDSALPSGLVVQLMRGQSSESLRLLYRAACTSEALDAGSLSFSQSPAGVFRDAPAAVAVVNNVNAEADQEMPPGHRLMIFGKPACFALQPGSLQPGQEIRKLRGRSEEGLRLVAPQLAADAARSMGAPWSPTRSRSQRICRDSSRLRNEDESRQHEPRQHRHSCDRPSGGLTRPHRASCNGAVSNPDPPATPEPAGVGSEVGPTDGAAVTAGGERSPAGAARDPHGIPCGMAWDPASPAAKPASSLPLMRWLGFCRQLDLLAAARFGIAPTSLSSGVPMYLWTPHALILSFVRSRDGISSRFGFAEFVEAFVRLALITALPTYEDLTARGCRDAASFFDALTAEQRADAFVAARRRASGSSTSGAADFSQPPSARADQLLTLVFSLNPALPRLIAWADGASARDPLCASPPPSLPPPPQPRSVVVRNGGGAPPQPRAVVASTARPATAAPLTTPSTDPIDPHCFTRPASAAACAASFNRRACTMPTASVNGRLDTQLDCMLDAEPATATDTAPAAAPPIAAHSNASIAAPPTATPSAAPPTAPTAAAEPPPGSIELGYAAPGSAVDRASEPHGAARQSVQQGTKRRQPPGGSRPGGSRPGGSRQGLRLGKVDQALLDAALGHELAIDQSLLGRPFPTFAFASPRSQIGSGDSSPRGVSRGTPHARLQSARGVASAHPPAARGLSSGRAKSLVERIDTIDRARSIAEGGQVRQRGRAGGAGSCLGPDAHPSHTVAAATHPSAGPSADPSADSSADFSADPSLSHLFQRPQHRAAPLLHAGRLEYLNYFCATPCRLSTVQPTSQRTLPHSTVRRPPRR